MTTGERSHAAADTVEELQVRLVRAEQRARDAYRDSARLIRLLGVLGQPLEAEELLTTATEALSQAFTADIVCLVPGGAGDLEGPVPVLAACGFPLGASAVLPALPGLLPRAGEPLAQAARAWTSADPAAPPVVAGVPVRSGASALVRSAGHAEGHLVLLRQSATPLTPTETTLLGSVAERLCASLEGARRRHTAEVLAASGVSLARHLDDDAVLADALEALRRLTGAEHAAALEVLPGPPGSSGSAVVRCSRGLDDDVLSSFPLPVEHLTSWPTVLTGATYVADEPDPRTYGSGVLGRAGLRSTLCVPTSPPGRGTVLLYALSSAPAAFGRVAVEGAEQLSGYLSAALVSTHLIGELSRGEARLRALTDAMSDVVVAVDRVPAGAARGALVRWASGSCERELGTSPGALLGTDLLDLVHVDDRAYLAGHLAGASTAALEHRLADGQGGWAWVETRTAPGGQDDVVVSSRPIGDRRDLQQALQHRATHDALTGLANRDLLRERLVEAAGRDAEGHVGVLFCDLDDFKAVNDRLGHDAGDQLLRGVAGRLQSELRPGDVLARQGGDEFVVLLDPVRGPEAVEDVGTRLLACLQRPFALGTREGRVESVTIGASIGGLAVERGPDAGTRADDLLRDADAAMYEAKRTGRGRVVLFDIESARQSLLRLDLREDIRAALTRGELSLAYQPVVDLATDRVHGLEALLRWTHPVHGPVSPDVFIPLAEETGAITAIGAWVLRRACTDVAGWRRLPGAQDLQVAVNLSPAQLSGPEVVRDLLVGVAESGLRPQDVTFEVTEGLDLDSPAVQHLRTLRQAGADVAIDDFGVQYSNLSRLKRVPAGSLKIDRSLVDDLTGARPLDLGVVRAIIALADAAGLGLIAEGIETPEQRRLLTEMGCRLGQGYLLGRPVPAAGVRDLLALPALVA